MRLENHADGMQLTLLPATTVVPFGPMGTEFKYWTPEQHHEYSGFSQSNSCFSCEPYFAWSYEPSHHAHFLW